MCSLRVLQQRRQEDQRKLEVLRAQLELAGKRRGMRRIASRMAPRERNARSGQAQRRLIGSGTTGKEEG